MMIYQTRNSSYFCDKIKELIPIENTCNVRIRYRNAIFKKGLLDLIDWIFVQIEFDVPLICDHRFACVEK